MSQATRHETSATLPAPPPAKMPSLEEVARHTLEIRFTSDERTLIRDSYCEGASEIEFQQLLRIAESRGLSPFKGQCHFTRFWNNQLKRWTWIVQVSIDGMRARAEASGLYDGQDEPEFEEDEDGHITLARVKVYRRDWNRPAVGVCYWDEFVQTNKDGDVSYMWQQKPRHMLSKCAEAQGLRKAFPERLGDTYAPEELADEPSRGRSRPAPVPTEDELAQLAERAKVLGLTGGQLARKMGKKFERYTRRDVDELNVLLEAIESGKYKADRVFPPAPRPAPQQTAPAQQAPVQQAPVQRPTTEPKEAPKPATPTPKETPDTGPKPGELVIALGRKLRAAATRDELETIRKDIAKAHSRSELTDPEFDELNDICRQFTEVTP